MTAISPASARHVSSGSLILSNRRATSAASAMSAVPDRIAEVTKSGAMSAVFHHGLEICRPKIHAVIECSSTAVGRPAYAMTRSTFARFDGSIVRLLMIVRSVTANAK